jgi:hypothetical protein
MADIKHRKFADAPSRNSKTNSVQNGKDRIRAKVNLNKKQCIKVIP